MVLWTRHAALRYPAHLAWSRYASRNEHSSLRLWIFTILSSRSHRSKRRQRRPPTRPTPHRFFPFPLPPGRGPGMSNRFSKSLKSFHAPPPRPPPPGRPPPNEKLKLLKPPPPAPEISGGVSADTPRRTTQPTRGERGGATRSAGFLAGPRRGRELRAARRQRARVRGAPFMPFIISSIIFSRFCPSRPNTAWNTCSASSCRPRGRQRRARKVHHPTAGQHPAARMPHTPPHPCTKWTRRVPHPVLIGHAASRSPLTCDNGCPLPKPPGKPPGKPSKPCPPPPLPPAPNMS